MLDEMKFINYLLFIFIPCSLFAAQICGPTVTNMDYSYTVENPSGTIAGYWAVGTECANGETTGDINTSCQTVMTIGRADCKFKNNVNQISGTGAYCHCTRLKAFVDGELKDSEGRFVQIGNTQGDTNLCFANCSRMCVEVVVNNINGYRDMIMLFPPL